MFAALFACIFVWVFLRRARSAVWAEYVATDAKIHATVANFLNALMLIAEATAAGVCIAITWRYLP